MSYTAKDVKSVTRWVPNAPPAESIEGAYLFEELKRLSDVLFNIGNLRLDITYVEPDKFRDGDIRYADGTEWNPGSGVGVYIYISNSWVKL